MSLQDNLTNLLNHQRKNIKDIGLYGELSFDDMKRLDLAIDGDPTSSNDCCLYNGPIINKQYCSLSYKGTKCSIIRLIYHNFVKDVEQHHRIFHTCKNKGICCNYKHLYVKEFNFNNTPKIEESGETNVNEEIFSFS